jgi:hypothetical protein
MKGDSCTRSPAVGKRLRGVGQEIVRCVKQHTVVGRKLPNVS